MGTVATVQPPSDGMLIGKPDRRRSRPHMAAVGEEPCCVPGCRARGWDVQVHHLTHVQPKARGLKAGDQWTVPLCLTHHAALHARGDERAWWSDVGVDPIALARALWAESIAEGRVK